MTIQIKAFANADSATVVWRSSERIPGCRGFALHRRQTGTDGKVSEVVLENRIGFENDPHAQSGAHQSSDIWPIQRFTWSDNTAAGAGTVSYRIVAKLGSAGHLTDGEASDWSNAVAVSTGKTPGFNAYFNRGIVASQWVARELAKAAGGTPSAELKQSITDPQNPLRAELGGVLREAMLDMLEQANNNGETLYVALYELNDPELIEALKAFGKRCNLLLGSGAYKSGEPDENATVREQLKASGKIQVFDRIVSSPHFAHNKFVVFCDAQHKALRVWTGSTNWTVNGLCTQVNNGILVESPALAAAYLQRWNTLHAAGNSYPPDVAKQGSVPAHTTLGTAAVTAWNAPTLNLVDLADARRLIQGARQGVLFLFFNPGPQGTLLNDILALQQDNLYIHGVVNQDPGGAGGPILTLHEHGNKLDAEPEVVLPAAIDAQLERWFTGEERGGMVMIHSKVVLIDPFGPHPVLMTGSHNLGPKASSKNDDNLLIVENAPGLASEYAVHILNVFDHYKFRYAHAAFAKLGGTAKKPWNGLQDNDTWQDGYYAPARVRELDFLFGDLRSAPPGLRRASEIQSEHAVASVQ
ncbi:phospholipase D-like domain-containing protein [Ralstonia nicotianae]|uniref:phospholipase D-like domain-containing protein n=1 Tax=Ralstonia solanacearum species complex TaxID=3116862 RepID=UPI0002FDF4F6|nr:phospholipase D-like domain-containing protein [Ralstonia pseudosolanacearum]MCK4121144.1 hypothetical protein [Ralstonia pseudosolanacearum]QIK18381.1 hypothetical protein G7968_08065 [Ralstonia solanacearum]